MPKHTEAYLQILDCVRRAGRLMLKEEEPEIAVKGANDFVTARDREIQDFLIRELSSLFPRAFFIAEEKENFELPDTEGFIIDPIDGTTNFMNSFPCCAVLWPGSAIVSWSTALSIIPSGRKCSPRKPDRAPGSMNSPSIPFPALRHGRSA